MRRQHMLQTKERRDTGMNIPSCQADIQCPPVVYKTQKKGENRKLLIKRAIYIFLSDTYRGVIDVAR